MQCLRLYRVDGRETNEEERADAELTTPCVLGRGPVLKCAEKKISRRHLILEWDQKELELVITSVHQNPCFVKGKSDPDIRMLSTNDSATLNPGDKFGLFKESFWFRVDYDIPPSGSKLKGNATTYQDIKEAHNQEKLEERSNKVSSTPELLPEPRPSANDDFRHAAMTGNITLENLIDKPCSPTRELCCDKDGDERPNKEMLEVKPEEVVEQETYVPSKRVRQLPAWMMAEERGSPKEKMENKVLHGRIKKTPVKRAPREKKTPPKPQDKGRSPKLTTPRATAPRASTKKSPIKPKVHHEMSDSEDEEMDSSSPSPVKCYPTKQISPEQVSTRGETNKDEDENTIPKNSPRKKGISPTGDIGSEGGRAKCWTITHVSSSSSSPTPVTVPSDSSNTNPVPQAQVRPSCKYGAKCFRKNSEHKKSYAHPGDQDYDSSPEPDSDSEDTRPECEYGLSCYRKNPQHRKAYKHTRAVQPQRRAKKKARKVADDDSYDDDDDDGSDLDSFLYDGSSDDYLPTDDNSDSPMEADGDEEEDSKRLLKEAKKFIRKRK